MAAKSNRSSSSNSDRKYWWLAPLLLGVSALAAIVYAALTWGMLKELQDSNEMQFEFQKQVLQPVLTINVGRDIMNAGEADEHWLISGSITNAGQVPARKVRGRIFWDSDKRIHSFNKPFDLGEVILPPGGGTIEIQQVISKAEAVAILEKRELYFHAMAEYFDANNQKYFSFTTSECLYVEGKFLRLVPIESSIVLDGNE